MTTPARLKALTVAEVMALPAMPTIPQAAAAFGLSRETGYEMVRSGTFPVAATKFGARNLRCRLTDILAVLGLDNSEAARGPALTASEENDHSAHTRNGPTS